MSIFLLYVLSINILLPICNSTTENTKALNPTNQTNKSITFLSSAKTSPISKRQLTINFVCNNPELDCSGNGACNDSKTDCICNVSYSTINKDSSTVRCDYLMKSQLKAFLLELFVGFGAGHFYSLRYLHASLKLVAFLFGIYLICLFPLTAKCISDKFDSDFFVFFVSCFYYLCVIGLAFWFVWDLVMFGLNKYNDGNDLPLLNWGSS